MAEIAVLEGFGLAAATDGYGAKKDSHLTTIQKLDGAIPRLKGQVQHQAMARRKQAVYLELKRQINGEMIRRARLHALETTHVDRPTYIRLESVRALEQAVISTNKAVMPPLVIVVAELREEIHRYPISMAGSATWQRFLAARKTALGK